MKMNVDDKILTPLIIAAIHLIDVFGRKVFLSVGKRLSCKIGDHDFVHVPDNEFMRTCEKCGMLDDIRTDGIDGEKKSRRRKRRKKKNEKADSAELPAEPLPPISEIDERIH